MIRSWKYAAFVTMLLQVGAAVATQIVVGQVGPMSGLEASQGRAYAMGMQLRFDAINKTGGVNGHTFALVRKDDAGRPEDTVALTKQLIAEDKPLVLAGYFGTRNIQGMRASGVLEKAGVALVGYRTADLHSEAPMMYSVRASLRDEINKIAEHLATIGITRLGLLYEDGDDSAVLVKSVEEIAKRTGAAIVTRARYPANSTAVASAVQAFLKQPPQAIILLSSGAASAAFIEGYRAGGGTAQLFAHSGADVEQLAKRLSEEQLQGLAIAQVTPSPYRITSRLAKDLVAAASAKPGPGGLVSFAMMEGYIAAGVIAEAVRRQGRTPTREGMPAALEGIRTFDLGGYVITFKPDQRTGSRFVELSIVNSSGKIRQ